MASETAPTRPVVTELDHSSWMARRAQDKGFGLDGDAFAQIFAHIQTDKAEHKAAPREADPSIPHDPPRHAWHERRISKSTRDSGKDDHAQDDDKSVTSDAAPHERPKTEAKKSEDKPVCEAKNTEDSTTEETPVVQAAVSETTDTDALAVDAPETAGADASSPTDDFKLAMGLATAAQAQTTDACQEDGENTGKEQTAAAGESALTGLLSFRANSRAGHEASGKKPVNDDGAPQIAEDTSLKPELKKSALDLPVETKQSSKTDLPPAQVLADTGQKPEDFHLLMKDWVEAKKESREQPAAAPAETEINSDTTVSTAPPAAGSRVNAHLGFSAPAPTGSGGGSPSPTVKAAVTGVEGAPGMGLLQGNAAASLENGGQLQLVRTPRGMAHLPASEQVGVTLVRMARAGVDRFDLELHPADLGKVDIRIEIKDGLVRATITADNQAAYDTLQKDSRSLERVLEQAGLKTDSGSLSFNLREEGQAQREANSSDTPGWKRWPEKLPVADAADEASAYVVAPGRVDMRV